ncbi:hypothetical protein [uncultured Gammaproteobacteria bacterium]|nr:hypothetical protein [uncultured Gammaproteobacteria bacterium]
MVNIPFDRLIEYCTYDVNLRDEDLKSNDRYKNYRNKINLKRGFAGAKGIGRFSADKIGANLKLIAKNVNANNAHQLDVNWQDFEKNSQDEFINIGVKHTELSSEKYQNFRPCKPDCVNPHIL